MIERENIEFFFKHFQNFNTLFFSNFGLRHVYIISIMKRKSLISVTVAQVFNISTMIALNRFTSRKV